MSPEEAGLPHRAPFLFVEEVLECGAGRAVARKVFAADDPVFQGHFPGNPLVPGVLLIEALAQTAGLALGQKRPLLLCAVSRMKFPAAARPGEELRLEAVLAAAGEGTWMFEVTARTVRGVVAAGAVTLGDPSR